MGGVLWDYPSGPAQLSPETLKESQGRPYAVPRVFSLMKPLNGGLYAFKKLAKDYAHAYPHRHPGTTQAHDVTSIIG